MKNRRISTAVAIVCLAVLAVGIGAIAALKTDALSGFSGDKAGFPPDVKITGTEGDLTQDIKQIDTPEKGAEELIKTTIDAEAFFRKTLIDMLGRQPVAASIMVDLSEFNELYPIECIRKVNDERVYVVYKLKYEGEDPFLAYLFFDKTTISETERWQLVWPTLYVEKRLSSKDFAGVEQGAKLADIAKIDPFILRQKPVRYDIYLDGKDPETGAYVIVKHEIPVPSEFTIHRCLTDGLISIHFVKGDTDDDFVVSSVGLDEILENSLFVTSDGGKALIDPIDLPVGDD
jgi:hypothetical protein